MPIPSQSAWREVQEWLRKSQRQGPPRSNQSQSTRVPKQPWRIVETDGDHAKAATQACKILTGDKGSETDSGETLDCYNRMTTLVDGTRCIAAWINNGWELIQAECEPSGGE